MRESFPVGALPTKVKECRKRLGLTQKELGDMMGKSKSAISKLENKNHNSRFFTLCRALDVMGVKWDIITKEK